MKPFAAAAFGLAAVVVIAVGAVGVAVLTGAVDLSATKTPSALERSVARFILERSLERRAPKIANPVPSSSGALEEGLSHYRTNCLGCHGGPGVDPFEFGKGLNPPAPDLSAPATQARRDGELFWIVRHGIRLTGMPAFQPTHSDEEIWTLVATIRHLEQLTGKERAFLEAAHETQQHRHDGGPSGVALDSHAHLSQAADDTASVEPHSHAPAPSAPHSAEPRAPHRANEGHEHHHEAEPSPAPTETHSHSPGKDDASHPTESESVPTHHPPADSTKIAQESEGGHATHQPGAAKKTESNHGHGASAETEPAHTDTGAVDVPESVHEHGATIERGHAGGGTDHTEHGERGMTSGLFGPYAMSREASGTSWQPEHAAHEGLHEMHGTWMFLLHGFATGVYDDQGGMRGDEDVFGASMLMGIARRPVGHGTLGFRVMLSGDPITIGKHGYPLLLQTGETADGREPLIDRQHPHDLLMEVAASISVLGAGKSAFLYLGMPGEPALGPPAFMHRFSGLAAPLAPISHHWLDSTHITFGVATVGFVHGPAKVEASLFTGREPDEERYGWDSPEMDSQAFRVSYNPGPAWSFQTSFGRLESPEQLHPDVDQDRTTTSIMFNPRPTWGDAQVTLAWGRNRNRPGRILDMFLVEAAAQVGRRHTAFARAERGEKDELFMEEDPRADRAFTVGQVIVGYIFDVMMTDHTPVGIGCSVGGSFVPAELDAVYGETPVSGTIFARVIVK